MNFKLTEGVEVDNTYDVHSAYCISEDGAIAAVLSSELLMSLAEAAVEKMKERVFFFIELPCSEQEEKKLRKSKRDRFHCKVYYLDGCTIPVAKAILKRYGELLVNDGLSRFGFGSHEIAEEIYFRDYQLVSIWGEVNKFEEIFTFLDLPREDDLKTLGDVLSEENPGRRGLVEINGETVYDIPLNLEAEGMYLAETREEV